MDNNQKQEDAFETSLKAAHQADLRQLETELAVERERRGGRLPPKLVAALNAHSPRPLLTDNDFKQVLRAADSTDLAELKADLDRKRAARGNRLPLRLEDAMATYPGVVIGGHGLPHRPLLKIIEPYLKTIAVSVVALLCGSAAALAFVQGEMSVSKAKEQAAMKETRIAKEEKRVAEEKERVAQENLARLASEFHIKPPTPEAQKDEFARGRRFKFAFTGGQIAIIPPAEFRPPRFVGLDVQWEEGDSPLPVVKFGYMPTPVMLTHQYKLPAAGNTRRVTLTLIYHVSQQAADEFNLPSYEVVERYPLLLTAEGGKLVADQSISAVSAKIDNIPEGVAELPSQFPLRFTVTPPSDFTSTTPDRVLRVVTRPLDGPSELRHVYSVQPFETRVSELAAANKREQVLETRVDLFAGTGLTTATRFEVLIVEIQFDLGNAQWSKSLLDLDLPGVRDATVRAWREVRVIQPTDVDSVPNQKE